MKKGENNLLYSSNPNSNSKGDSTRPIIHKKIRIVFLVIESFLFVKPFCIPKQLQTISWCFTNALIRKKVNTKKVKIAIIYEKNKNRFNENNKASISSVLMTRIAIALRGSNSLFKRFVIEFKNS
nr:hypothetical protein [Rossellomorea arthrocnemi]